MPFNTYNSIIKERDAVLNSGLKIDVLKKDFLEFWFSITDAFKAFDLVSNGKTRETISSLPFYILKSEIKEHMVCSLDWIENKVFITKEEYDALAD